VRGTVQLPIRSSPLLGVALCVAHGVAIAMLWASGLPVTVAAAGTTILAVGLAWQLWSGTARHRASAIAVLELREDGTLAACTRDGRWREGTVAGSTFVTPWLTVVHVRLDGARHASSVLLLPDNVNREDFRRARVWLRWKSGAAPELRLPTV
jgi:toxin CptA